MLLHKETAAIQSGLSGYCRTGVAPELPGITPDRIHQYRRLVYGVISDTLESAFPVTFQFLPEEEWEQLVHDFFSNHACYNYSVWKMPYEFYEFYAQQASPLKEKYPFLVDLLYFEWIEIEVHTMPDEEIASHHKTGDVLKDRLYANPEFRLIQLNYPVHQLNPSQISCTEHGADYFVLVYRHQDSGDVEFFGISPLHAYIISLLAENAQTLPDLIGRSCEAFGLDNNQQTRNHIIAFIQTLKDKNFILGFQ